MEKGKSKTEKPKVEKKKVVKKLPVVDELTDEEREAVTIVFHQYETGLREGTILVKVSRSHSVTVAHIRKVHVIKVGPNWGGARINVLG